MPTRPNPRAPVFPFPKPPSATPSRSSDVATSNNWRTKPAGDPFSSSFPTPACTSTSSTQTPLPAMSSSPGKMSESVDSIASSATSFEMVRTGAPLRSHKDASTSTPSPSSDSNSNTSDRLAPLEKRWTSSAPFEFVPRGFTTPLNKQTPSEGEEATPIANQGPPTTAKATTKRIDIPAQRLAPFPALHDAASPSDGKPIGFDSMAAGMYGADYSDFAPLARSNTDAYPQYADSHGLGQGDIHSSQTRSNSPPFFMSSAGHSYGDLYALSSDDSNSTSESSGADFFRSYGQGHQHPLAFARVPPPAVPSGTLLHRQSAPEFGAQRSNDPPLRLNNPIMDQYAAINEMGGRGVFGLDRAGGSTGEGVAKCNVYIHAIPAGMTCTQLQHYAERFGDVSLVKVAGDEDRFGIDIHDGKRYAYVRMATHDQAMQLMSGLRGQGLACELAKEDWQTEYKAREDRNSSNVYVVGLPMEWVKDDVDDYMTQFGRVASLRLLEDKEGNRRGPILVRFDSRVQAERAIFALNGNVHPISGERMQARVADSDGQKDYKKLRSTADSMAEERRPSMSNSEDVNMIMNVDQLLAIREKYERKLQMINVQLSSLAPHQARSLAQASGVGLGSGSIGFSGRGGARSRPNLNLAQAAHEYRQRQLSHDWGTPPGTATFDPLASPLTAGTGADILTPPPTIRHFSHGAATPGSVASPSRHRTMSAQAQPFPVPHGQQDISHDRRFSTVGPSLSRSLALPQADQRSAESYQPHGQGPAAGLWHARSTSDLASAQMPNHGDSKSAKSFWPAGRA